ncbi:hypothetical protein E3N88_03555 [Mikania micrantha]|uniref:CCR4-Not complex component Not N-terminal domain-containing protein n=1 Tax=Mikania micrantha TaxID=192012 RepID=A0A5N6Q700_9ASTR|nr:hypothetical protein E3N88_03555 [Mikania micrantha]
MGASRKLQTEINRVLKKVQEGAGVFDSIWNKLLIDDEGFLMKTMMIDDEDTKKVLIDDDEREAAIESKGERQCDYEKPRSSYTKTSADRRIQVPGIRLEV